jgi:hypothetical protein
VSDRIRAWFSEPHNWIGAFLAIATTLGFFLFLRMIILRDVPAGAKQTIDILVGILGTCWVSIINYFFRQAPPSQGPGPEK